MGFLILLGIGLVGYFIFWFMHYFIYYSEKFDNMENARTNREILNELKKQNADKKEE